MLNGLRLSLTSGAPVSAPNTTSSTVYLVPFVHGQIELYTSRGWSVYETTGTSLTLSGLTTRTNYDVFAYYDTATASVKIELGSAWDSPLVRNSDPVGVNSITRIDGVYVKTLNYTRRYIGTIRTISTTQTIDSSSQRFVWNFYNQVERQLNVVDTTNTWTTTGGGFQIVGYKRADVSGVAGVNAVEYVIGMADVVYHAQAHHLLKNGASTANPNRNQTGFEISVTSGSLPSTNNALVYGSNSHSTTLYTASYAAGINVVPAFAGYKQVSWVEGSDSSVTIGAVGDNGLTVVQTGLVMRILA